MRKLFLPVLAVLAFVFFQSVTIVPEGTRAIMLRFNKVQRDGEQKVVVYSPGLHFKVPFMDSLKVLDARIQTLSLIHI